MVVVDVDMSAGRSGFEDFRRLAGCDPHAVTTPQASTPSGGRHVVYAASKAYKNAVAIAGTGIDVRSLGGYIVLPGGNGREWRRPLIGVDGVMVPLAAAPAWLDGARRQSPVSRAPLVLAPQAALIQPAPDSDSLCAEGGARAARARLRQDRRRALRRSGRHQTPRMLHRRRSRRPRRLGLCDRLCGPARSRRRHASLSRGRAVARSRRSRRPLARGRHGCAAADQRETSSGCATFAPACKPASPK